MANSLAGVDGVTLSSDQFVIRNIMMGEPLGLEESAEIGEDDLSDDQRIDLDAMEQLAAPIVRDYKEESQVIPLEAALDLLHKPLDLCPADYPLHSNSLDNLALPLSDKFHWTGDVSNMDEVIRLMDIKVTEGTMLQQSNQKIEVPKDKESRGECNNESYNLLPNKDKASSIIELALDSLTKLCQSGSISNLESANLLYRQVISQRGRLNDKHAAAIYGLAEARVSRWFHSRQTGDLDEAVSTFRDCLQFPLTVYSDRPQLQSRLCACPVTKFLATGQPHFITEAARLCLRVSERYNQGAEALYLAQQAVGVGLLLISSKDATDIDRAALLLEAAACMIREQNPAYCHILKHLAIAVTLRCLQTGQGSDLDRSSVLLEGMMQSLPNKDRSVSFMFGEVGDSFVERFKHTTQTGDLEKANSMCRKGLMLLPTPHPDRSSYVNSLGSAFMVRFKQSGQAVDLEEAISLYRETLILCPAIHPIRSVSLNNLGNAVKTRFEQTGQVADLEECISLHRESFMLRSAPHPLRSDSLNNLASAVKTRFDRAGQVADLEEAISLHRDSLILRPAPHPDRSASLNNLANAVLTRFKQTGQAVDLEEAISLYRESLKLHLAPHPDRSMLLNNLGNAVKTRFEKTGQVADLEEAISLHRESLMLRSAPHPLRSDSLNNLGAAVLTRFQQTGQVADLEESISLHRESLGLLPAPHPNRSISLTNLGNAVLMRFHRAGQVADLEEAISLHRDSLILRPALHPGRSRSLAGLANAIITRFWQTGQAVDLEEAISLYRESLKLRPAPHPVRSALLDNLGVAVMTRFQQIGRAVDLEEAISLHRDSLTLRPTPHPDRSMSLMNLGSAVMVRFQQTGQMVDLDEAISLYRGSLMLRPAPHVDRSKSLNNLGIAVKMRFERTGQVTDLEEAISLHRDALMLRPPSHPDRSMSLNNLGNAVIARFEQTGQAVDLEEAISLHRDSLILHSAPHLDRSTSLNNLAIAVMTKVEQTGQAVDLDEAISLYRESLILRPAPHPFRSGALHNIANALMTRFNQTRHIADLDEGILLRTEALDCLPMSHPHRCFILFRLASSLLKKISSNDSSLNGSLDTAVDLFRTAVRCETASVLDRLKAAQTWARCADERNHTSALEAYQLAIQLYPLVSMLASSISSRTQLLADKLDPHLPADAAACAIRLGQLEQAVELLEEGRAIFWSQALQFRTPLDDLWQAHPDLAHKLQDLSQALEWSSFRDSQMSLREDARGVVTMEAEAATFRRLHEDRLATLERIRALEGFNQFLFPQNIESLKRAAARGPVVLLNANLASCDALIVTPTGVQHVPLSINLTGLDIATLAASVYSAASKSRLPQTIQDSLKSLVQEAGGSRSGLDEEDRKQRPSAQSRPNRPPPDILRDVLAILWRSVVRPVIVTLKLKKMDCESIEGLPRVWWCPTGLFSILPVHAAGIYHTTMGDLENASEYMISSYTPTLRSLLVPPPIINRHPLQMLVVIQPETEGYNALHGTREEMRRIERHVPSPSLVKFGSVGAPPSNVEAVLGHLPHVSIAHFACHGVQDRDPLESALLLNDGRLDIATIMKLPLPNASLAFLSACETAQGDLRHINEAMHLAATMLFAGFRGVVGTMWSIADPDGPVIADEFYGHLFQGHEDGSQPDCTQAARALHLAVINLRKRFQEGSFLRWVPFVHYGL